MLVYSALTLLLVTSATVVAQQELDCPDEVADCPDNCGDAQCARFLNAECKENPCHGLCSPNFFWRGRNVTERCSVERCSERECPEKRICVEEVRPSSCRVGVPRSECRQHIRAACVLPPPPKNCSQITCEEGMICQDKKRGKGVTCVRPRNCNQLPCDEGFLCTQTEQGPRCVASVGRSCNDLNCPQGTICLSTAIPTRNFSLAQCIDRREAFAIPTFDEFSCDSGAMICSNEETHVCIEIFQAENFLQAYCLEVNCDLDAENSCQRPDRVCMELPESLQSGFPYTSACTPFDTMFSTTCAVAAEDRCRGLPGFTCNDFLVDGNIVATGCGPSATTYSGPSCAELQCPVPLRCFERIVERRGGVAQCTTDGALDLLLAQLGN